MEFLLPKSLPVENENLNSLNTVLSVEFLAFNYCALDEQETDFIPIPICRTGKNTFVGLPKQKPHRNLTWSKALLLCIYSYTCAVPRCKRDKGLLGKINTMETSQCWNPKFAFGERGLNPCYVSGKKAGTLMCIIQENNQRNFPLWCNLAEKRKNSCFSYYFNTNLYGRSFHCSLVNSTKPFFRHSSFLWHSVEVLCPYEGDTFLGIRLIPELWKCLNHQS